MPVWLCLSERFMPVLWVCCKRSGVRSGTKSTKHLTLMGFVKLIEFCQIKINSPAVRNRSSPLCCDPTVVVNLHKNEIKLTTCTYTGVQCCAADYTFLVSPLTFYFMRCLYEVTAVVVLSHTYLLHNTLVVLLNERHVGVAEPPVTESRLCR